MLLDVLHKTSRYLLGVAIRVVRRPCHARICAVQDECGHALRVRRGERDGKRSAFRATEHGGSLRADSVHHSAQIIHPFLERRHRDAIGQSGATLVEHDQTTKRRESLEVSALGWVLPLQLEVRDEWWNVNEVEGSIADDLIGDVHVARLRVPSFGNFEHCVSLGRCHGDDRRI